MGQPAERLLASRQTTQTMASPVPQPKGLMYKVSARSSNSLRLGQQRKGRSWLSSEINRIFLTGFPRRPRNPTAEGPVETIDGKDRHRLPMG